jgi:hypothetical protein
VFAEMDVNGDGALSAGELQTMLGEVRPSCHIAMVARRARGADRAPLSTDSRDSPRRATRGCPASSASRRASTTRRR